MNPYKFFLNHLKNKDEEARSKIAKLKPKFENHLEELKVKLGVLDAQLVGDELIFLVQDWEAAKKLENQIYNPSLSIQKAPIPGEDIWEVRVS